MSVSSDSLSNVEKGEGKRIASIFNSSTHLTGDDRKCVTWQHIGATVPDAGKNKKKGAERRMVLEEVFGVAYPGEILAIMGASGAGKTTLMNILAMQKSSVVESHGTVKVNNMVVTEREMQRMSAYVQQVDVFCGSITVREQLNFSALMRLPESITEEERRRRVDLVVRQMNLTDCQNTLIGTPGKMKGISIGEKKRLAFACEVLKDPPILFCDEPTSGLDSFMASQVVVALKEMASTGKTVITVIHQPSSEVFNMFDTVCFMASGKPAFHGPVKAVCSFFASLNRPELCVPESYNPADHAITHISTHPETKEADMERIGHIRKSFEESDYGRKLIAESDPHVYTSNTSHAGDEAKPKRKRYATGFLRQLRTLMHRSFLTTLRDPVLLRVRIVQILLTASIIGMVSWRTEIAGPTVMNIEGVLYNVARDMNFLFLFPSVNFICAELPLFFREHKARIYSVEAYYLSKSFAELPQYTVLPLTYAIIVYWTTGLIPMFSKFIIFCVINVLQVWVATSIAYAGACIFGEEGMAVTYIPIYILPMLLFGGFYINYNSIPVYFQWLSHLSWFKYGFESLQINQWEEIDSIAGCPRNDTLPKDCTAYDGLGILTRRGMKTESFMPDVLCLVGFFVIYRLIGFFALFMRAKFQKSDA